MNENSLLIPYPEEPRAGCKDIWNAYILRGATYDMHDIPFCPTTATTTPKKLISIKDAEQLYMSEMKKGNKDFKYDAFIHPYIDDQAFDGRKEDYWDNPDSLVNLAKHFDGIITLDYSTYLDFPEPFKMWNVLRSRTLGIHTANSGIPTINNVRWGEEETWDYSFAGLPKHSMYAIGSVASGIRRKGYNKIFENGLMYMADKLEPNIIIVVGSDRHPAFDELRKRGIIIITFKSDTAKYYERRFKK